MSADRPFVSINLALSADGKISSASRRPSGWTSSADLQRLKSLRLPAQALLVGRGTLEADRMTLASPHQPWRCVISRQGRFDPSHPLFHQPGGPIHLVATHGPAPSLPHTTGHSCSLPGFLQFLHRNRIGHLHVEGGGELIRSLLEIGAVDRIHLTWAGHRLFGGLQAPTLAGTPADFLHRSQTFRLREFLPQPESGECFLTYERQSRT